MKERERDVVETTKKTREVKKSSFKTACIDANIHGKL